MSRDLSELAAAADGIVARPGPAEPGADDEPRAELPQPRPERLMVGIVLAGGAAKGGYQVGAVEALAAAGTRIDAVAGTSIGALNGAVLATSPTLAAGAARLVAMWQRFTAAVGAPPVSGAGADDDGRLAESSAAQALNALPRVLRLVLNKRLLESMVEEAVRPDALRGGRPLFVAAYPVLAPIDIPVVRFVQYLLDWTRRWVGQRSRILHLNPMAIEDARTAVLASAALPLLFRTRKVEGKHFRDGMLGGDNLPVRALARAGCRIVVAVHLGQLGVLRDDEHPDVTVLEIRPSVPLVPGGPLGGLSGPLDFSPRRFAELRAMGYADAVAVLGQLRSVLSAAGHRRAAQAAMVDAVDRLDEPL